MFYLCALFAFAAGVGVLRSARLSVLMFVWLVLVVPTGNSYADVISRSGIYFYDFYLLGAFVGLVFMAVAGRAKRLVGDRWVVLMLAVFFIYFFIFGLTAELTKYFIKDTRPVMAVLLFLVVANFARAGRFVLSSREMCWLVVVGGVFNFLDLLWIKMGVVAYKDEYYEVNSYRYLDVATYFSVAFIIYYVNFKRYFERERRLALIATVVAVACVLLSNSRFVLLSTLLAVLVTQVSSPKRFFQMAILGLSSMGLFFWISYLIGAERIVSGLESEGLLLQIVTRYGPGLDLIEGMSFSEAIFGFGPGTFFDIPWFAYRGLESENVNIDCAYLTFYVKYGVFSALVLFGYVRAFLISSVGKMKAAAYVFFGLIFLVSASPYQPYAIGFGVACILLASLDSIRSGARLDAVRA